jgi:short-subunit dehydrogenase
VNLLAGKVAVVTGASMGIGEAIAQLFADEGAAVVLSSRDAARVEAARERIGHLDRTLALACDVRNREEIERLLALALHNFGRVDIWVNNAGHGLSDSVAHMDMDACRELFDTNLFGAIDGLQVAAPAMRRQRSGTIVNIASVAGHITLPFASAYSASKFALLAFGNAARMELKGSGVHILNVSPGFVATNFSQNVVRGSTGRRVDSPIRGTTAERVARAVLYGYLKQRREVVVPWFYRIFITLHQLLPGLVEYGMTRMARRMPANQDEAAAVNADAEDSRHPRDRG